MSKKPALNLGAWRHIDGTAGGNILRIPANHLVTHSVVVGMTGSGKTGLVTVLVEEALSAGIPTIIIDVKGVLPNLLLTFPSFDPELVRPWVETEGEAEQKLGTRATLRSLGYRSRIGAQWPVCCHFFGLAPTWQRSGPS
jgi:DNA helicase HerA-like ATPase